MIVQVLSITAALLIVLLFVLFAFILLACATWILTGSFTRLRRGRSKEVS